VTLDDATIGGVAPDADVIRLDDALQALAAQDTAKAASSSCDFSAGASTRSPSRCRSRLKR
jgi:hypothetical protein